ncbi:hypothetical protein HAX54_042190 [Datura stramonium]|uniref:Uncharacterized protein n=1 Tax=Datura stramonium TaxID=4076 RepID=A0ABS8SLX8_DATST|nr:hypothetical protein [Datura stramonium]
MVSTRVDELWMDREYEMITHIINFEEPILVKTHVPIQEVAGKEKGTLGLITSQIQESIIVVSKNPMSKTNNLEIMDTSIDDTVLEKNQTKQKNLAWLLALWKPYSNWYYLD